MPAFFSTNPRDCLLVLASSTGSRLYPMTSSDFPKHLLPIGGTPCILRLLEAFSHMSQIIVAVSSADTKTLSVLETIASIEHNQGNGKENVTSRTLEFRKHRRRVDIFQLSETCSGSLDAVREIEEAQMIYHSTRVLVVPGDLVLLKADVNLDPLLRLPTNSIGTLLIDVGEVDIHGLPLKESAKSKKGGFARDEEEIDYIGLSYPLQTYEGQRNLPRIVLKESKLRVEADDDMTGSTAKLQVLKAKLRGGKLLVKTSWNDVHVYSLPSWVRKLVCVRKGLSNFEEDLMPLLIARQFQGKTATFGAMVEKEEQVSPKIESADENEYSVSAMVLSDSVVVRSNTISAYHFGCRETVADIESLGKPIESKWNGKFQTLLLKDSMLGAKINMKSTTVGVGCNLGAKCRLNNVVIMDNVTIGENCSLQNTLIGSGAKLGNNCSLNDCQVGPAKDIPAGTKEKGESFIVGDVLEEGGLL